MNGRATPPTNQEQVHIDIGALAQRVTGVEGTLQQIWGALGDLSKKLDAKPTNWWGIIGGLMAVLTVIGGGIGMLTGPMNSDISRHEREISRFAEAAVNRADYFRDRDALEREFRERDDKQERWGGNLRDRLRDDEDHAVTQRQISELKERLDERYRISQGASETRIGSLERRIDTLDSQLVKRPEIEASNRSQDERLTALSARSNAIQAQVDALFPPSKIIDELWRGLAELRTGAVAPTKSGPP